jgi:hypothetical protein
MPSDLLSYTFAPKIPDSWNKNPTAWLSNNDISQVMKQYEYKYKCFNFIGPSPIDFDKQYDDICVWDELCQFKLLNHLRNDIHKIGIIFNTDPHDKSGEHWISLFINLKHSTIIFFDSTGDPPPKQVNVFIKKIILQGKEIDIDFKSTRNKIIHQKKNTECGVYSICFIIEMLKQSNPEMPEMFNSPVNDLEIQKFRNIYFNKSL